MRTRSSHRPWMTVMFAGSVVCGACTVLNPLSDYSDGLPEDVPDANTDVLDEPTSTEDSGKDGGARFDGSDDAQARGPFSFFGDAFAGTPSFFDPENQELGLRFTCDVDAKVIGVRFFRGPENIGPHTANLWSGSGTRLASGPFTNETSSGWQTMKFETPVPITAKTPYIASYRTNSGYYASTSYFFTNGLDVPPLHADPANGLFTLEADAMPDETFNATNYWVDVIIE